MSGTALGLVLVAALLHTAWNALAKRSEDQGAFLWVSVTLASLGLAPAAAWVVAREGLPGSAVPPVLATILLHALYFFALGRAYRAGEFSLVYPIARGLGVGLVPVAALAFLDERPSWPGAAGTGLVLLGILALHAVQQGRGSAAGALRRGRSGLGWALLTGLAITAYSLVDKVGVSRLHPVPYIVLLGLGSSLLLLPVVRADPGAVAREWRRRRGAILAAAAMNLTAYLLVLFAFRLSKVGYVVATREVSIVVSAAVGSTVLGEGRLGPRLAAALLVFAGVACIALAG